MPVKRSPRVSGARPTSRSSCARPRTAPERWTSSRSKPAARSALRAPAGRLAVARQRGLPAIRGSRARWLAVLGVSANPTGNSGTWALVSLADPERAPRFVPYTPVIGGSWSGTGWFATVTPGTNGLLDRRRRRARRRDAHPRSHAPARRRTGPVLGGRRLGHRGRPDQRSDPERVRDPASRRRRHSARVAGPRRPHGVPVVDRGWSLPGHLPGSRLRLVDRVNVWDADGNNVPWYAASWLRTS